jgi:hypothetical protein
MLALIGCVLIILLCDLFQVTVGDKARKEQQKRDLRSVERD